MEEMWITCAIKGTGVKPTKIGNKGKIAADVGASYMGCGAQQCE